MSAKASAWPPLPWISGEWVVPHNCHDFQQEGWTFTPLFQSVTLEGETSQDPLGQVMLVSLDSCSQCMVPRSASPEELVSSDRFLDLSPDLLNQNFWGWGPAVSGLTSLPGGSDTCSNLRTPALNRNSSVIKYSKLLLSF